MPKIVTKPGIDEFATSVGSHDLDLLVCVVFKSFNYSLDKLRCLILMSQEFLPPLLAVVVNHTKSVGKALD